MARQKRQSVATLTVEWEGLHSGVPEGTEITGFEVLYRKENTQNWNQHDGRIPYRGEHYQYRLSIRNVESGRVYYVKIRMLGSNGKVLLETTEIKATPQEGPATFRCSPGEHPFHSSPFQTWRLD